MKKRKKEDSRLKGTAEQRLKHGLSFECEKKGHEYFLTNKVARKRNPGNTKMKRLGAYLIPRGQGYRHPSEDNYLTFSYLH